MSSLLLGSPFWGRGCPLPPPPHAGCRGVRESGEDGVGYEILYLGKLLLSGTLQGSSFQGSLPLQGMVSVLEILPTLSLGFPDPSCRVVRRTRGPPGPPGSGSAAGLGTEPWPCQAVLGHVPGAGAVLQPPAPGCGCAAAVGCGSSCKCRSKWCSRLETQPRIPATVQNRNGFWLRSLSNIVALGLPRVHRFGWSRVGARGAESGETPASPCTAAPASLLRYPAPGGGIKG